MAKKSIPSTIKHQNCLAEPQWGNWGPHRVRLWCKEHNQFICWLPENLFEQQVGEANGRAIIRSN